MNKWKKAVSTLATASLLASVLTTAAVSTVLAAGPYGTAIPYTANVTSRPADGVSFIDLNFETTTAHTVTSIAVTGGTFIGGTGAFLGKTGATITLVPGSITLGDSAYLASTTAGTATVTVTFSDGTATTDSITSFTFTAASATTVSTAYSSTALSASSAPTSPVNTGVTATTTVRDSNNVAIAAGVSVTWTLSGPAYFLTGGTITQTVNADGSGMAVSSAIQTTGVAGAVTVATTVKYLNVSYTLATKTLTLVGPVTSLVLDNGVFSIPVDNSNASTEGYEIAATVTDAAGLNISSGVTFAVDAYTPANIFTAVPASAAWDSVDKVWYIDVDCVAVGTGTVSLKASTTAGTTTTTVTSTAPLTFVCANKLDAAHTGTMDISAAASSVAPNGNVNILVSVKDDGGRAAPDGTVVTAVTNGVGNVVSSKGVLNTTKTSNGTAKFIFLAPANAGSATVTAFVADATPSSKAVTISIGAAAGAACTTSGTPRYQALNKYITWTINCGTAAAGKTVGILVSTKSGSTYSAYTRLTGRVVNSSGIATFMWRSSTAKSIAVRADLDGALSNWIFGTWR